VLFSFIGLDRRIGILFLVLNAASISSHMIFSLNNNIAVQRPLSGVEIAGTMLEMLFALFTIGYLLNQYMIFQSYAEQQLKVANSELAAQNQVIVKKNEENNMLAKEIHHRVKNNLQIVISLLRMHSEEVRSEETKRHFAEAMNRIMAMSLIHQKLYREKELSNIHFEGYLQDLTEEILSSSGRDHRRVTCCIDCGVEKVGLKTIVPLGLLLNELLTNSLKHAFGSERSGTIAISISETNEGRILLEYADNGEWKSVLPDPEGGFGLELIGLLTSQLEGTVLREGSAYRFELNNLDH
jgi:two-component sensor histidine kinase